MEFRIEPKVYDYFPGMKIVALLVRELDNSQAVPGVTALLNEAYQAAGEQALAHGNAQSHPNVSVWGERMRTVGAPRKQFPSSIEAMLRRAGKGGVPFRINPLVDFYNAISFRHIVPAGAFAIAEDEVIELRFSRDGDTFQALDEAEPQPIPAGEVSYATDNTILTRHFVWRQAKQGLIEPKTTSVLLVSEILGELDEDLANKVLQDFQTGLKDYFGVAAKADILTATNLSLKG